MTGSPDSIRDEVIALLPRLRRFARLITRHREDADDLVQPVSYTHLTLPTKRIV